MNESTLKAAGELLIALGQRKGIERIYDKGWAPRSQDSLLQSLTNGEFNPSEWRIAEPPKFVPWETAEEVPVGSVVTHQKSGGRYIISSARLSDGVLTMFVPDYGSLDAREALVIFMQSSGLPCGKAAQS